MLKLSYIDKDGYVQLPEWVREKLSLKRSDYILFLEQDGEIVIKKVSPISEKEFKKMFEDILGKKLDKEEYPEEEMLNDLDEERTKLWEEWKHKYEHLSNNTYSRKELPPNRPWDKNRSAARVANHVHIMRKEYGWSREDLARKLGTTEEVIRRIEEVDYITEDE